MIQSYASVIDLGLGTRRISAYGQFDDRGFSPEIENTLVCLFLRSLSRRFSMALAVPIN